MTTTTATAARPAPVCAPAGIKLPCPYCGEPEATINLCLADAGFTCAECDSEFTVGEVLDIIERWQPILAWVSSMPTAAVSE